MREIKWVAINGLVALCMYFGFYKGVDGAANIALLFTWLSILFSPFLLADGVVEMAKKRGYIRPVPAYFSIVFDFTVMCALAFYGYVITAAFYFIHICLQEGFYEKLKLAIKTAATQEETA